MAATLRWCTASEYRIFSTSRVLSSLVEYGAAAGMNGNASQRSVLHTTDVPLGQM